MIHSPFWGTVSAESRSWVAGRRWWGIGMDKNIAFILSRESEKDNGNVKDPLNDLHKTVPKKRI